MKHQKVQVFTDGASRGNGSQEADAAIAVRILDSSGKELESYAECIGRKTNNQAEYMAFIKGLELARGHTQVSVDCFSDSNLVIQQMKGLWKVGDPKLKSLWIKAVIKSDEFAKVTYTHLRRTDHRIAAVDALANDVLDGTR